MCSDLKLWINICC